MAPPIFGPDQIDQNPGSVSLPSNPASGVAGGYQDDGYWRNFYMQQYGAQRPGVDFQTGNQDQARLRQQQVIQDLQRAALGDPNSRAQQGLRDAYGSATSQQSSLGSTMRGQSAGAAQRSIAAGQQGIQRGFAGDSQMLQIQEQQAAQQMLAQLLAQQQAQDIAQAQGMAQGTLGSQAQDDALRQFYLGGAGAMDLAATERQNQIGRAQLGFNDAQSALTQRLVNGGLQAGATAAGVLGGFGGPPPAQGGPGIPGSTGAAAPQSTTYGSPGTQSLPMGDYYGGLNGYG